MSIEIPSSPAELAIPFAERLYETGEFDSFARASDEGRQILIDLERFAGNVGMLGQTYFVESHRSLSVPVSFQSEEAVSYYNFGLGLTFEGSLATYGIVKVGRIIGAPSSVMALCLVFDKALLLPFLDNIEEGHLLYTPIYAVEEMSITS